MIRPVIHILFGVLLTGATAVAMGRVLLGRLRLHLDRTESWLFSFLLGSACLSAVLFALAALHLLYRGVYLGVAAAAIGAAWRFGCFATSADVPPLGRFWKWLFLGGWGFFGLVDLCYAMAPEWSPDGSTYHLGLVLILSRAHGFVPITTDFYKNMPAGIEILFLPAFTFGKHSAAAMVHFLFLLVLPWLMVCFGRRFGFAAAGVCAALLVFVSPVAAIDGTSAYVDLGLAAVLFGLFYLLQIWERERSPELLLAAGVLAGFAFAIKYTGAVGLFYGILFVGWKSRRSMAPFAGVAALWILPWILKSWIMLGNPLIPFLNGVFPNPYVHISFVETWSRNLRHYNLPNYRQLPLEITTRGLMTGGLLGPVFLLAPLGLFALRRSLGRRLLFCAAIFLLPYFSNIGTRFLLPALPFVALAMGIALSSAGAVFAISVVAAHLVLSFPAVTRRYCTPSAWTLAAQIPFKAALRITPEEQWLAERMPGYLIDRMLDQHVPSGEKIFANTQQAEAYTSREIRVAYVSARGEELLDALFTAVVPDFQPSVIEDFHFSPTALRAVRAVETAQGVKDQWSVTEFRVFRSGAEISRNARWRVRADPNSWDALFAFDNNLATRWRSWQSAKAGMFVELDFDKPVTLDEVKLESSRDQYQVKMKLEGRGMDGMWRDLALSPRTYDRPVTMSLRKSATDELKREGYHYLLIGEDSYGADDFRRNTAAWNLEKIDEKWGTPLYKIK